MDIKNLNQLNSYLKTNNPNAENLKKIFADKLKNEEFFQFAAGFDGEEGFSENDLSMIEALDKKNGLDENTDIIKLNEDYKKYIELKEKSKAEASKYVEVNKAIIEPETPCRVSFSNPNRETSLSFMRSGLKKINISGVDFYNPSAKIEALKTPETVTLDGKKYTNIPADGKSHYRGYYELDGKHYIYDKANNKMIQTENGDASKLLKEKLKTGIDEVSTWLDRANTGEIKIEYNGKLIPLKDFDFKLIGLDNERASRYKNFGAIKNKLNELVSKDPKNLELASYAQQDKGFANIGSITTANLGSGKAGNYSDGQVTINTHIVMNAKDAYIRTILHEATHAYGGDFGFGATQTEENGAETMGLLMMASRKDGVISAKELLAIDQGSDLFANGYQHLPK